MVGGAIGQSAGGKLGSVAGDWLGAGATRKGIQTAEATHKAMKVSSNPKYQQLPLHKKVELVKRRTKRFISQGKKEFTRGLKTDTVGWGIGNAASDSLQQAGVGGLSQAAGAIGVANATTNQAAKGIRVGKRVARQKGIGAGIRQGLTSTGRQLRRDYSPKGNIKKSFTRERKMYGAVNNEL